MSFTLKFHGDAPQPMRLKFGKIPDADSFIEPFRGEYEVLPATSPQIFETAGKKMIDDMTVLAIPYYEISNEHGSTVHIAPP